MDGLDRSFVIRGRVQGVGFRWWTRQTASALGVVGTVENLPDGTVRVLARAGRDVMGRFADKLRQGPPMARVESVEEAPVELPSELLSSFTIERS